MSTEITDYHSLKDSIARGKPSVYQIVSEHLRRIKNNAHLNAFITVYDERAGEQARAVDKRISSGDAGELAGMVVAVKDNIFLKDERVTCASGFLEQFRSLYDATVIRKLTEADAVIIGKTNMDEFAMGSSNENSAFGIVRNPVDVGRVPGGSSGGSAAAVAASLAMTALGSDTGGSIRQPASFTGVYGLKPTYGRASRYGLVAFASSFDQIGPFGRSVRDVALLLKIISGYDPYDSTSADIPVPDYPAALNFDLKGLRVGLPREYYTEDLDPEVRKCIAEQTDRLRSMGVEVVEVSLPHTEYTIATYYILTTAEASSNLARYDGVRYGYRSPDAQDLDSMYTESRTRGFGAEVKRRIMLGTYVLSSGYYDAYYRKAQKVRTLIKSDFDKVFSEVDALLTPTSPTTAFKHGEKTDDPLKMYLSDIYTTSANLAGIPGLNVPIGKDREGLPVGMQLLGKQFGEQILLDIAYALE
jgi:aspartyl-tRNA(Asn)/glutamyl-tRNA(Gln) amidotransferase subunit A